MKRKDYHPQNLSDQPEWHFNYADGVEEHGPGIGLVAAEITATVNDSRHLGYALGDWITRVREFGPGCTAQLEELRYGTGGTPFVLPTFVPPAPPAGLTDVLPGALNRLFKYVQAIKAAPGYTEGLGLLLGIVGEEDTTVHTRPDIGGLGVQRIHFFEFAIMETIMRSITS